MGYNITMKNTNQIQNIRKITGLSQGKFAEYFKIPLRTLQKWEIGQSTPPSYIPEMMERILKLEMKNTYLEKMLEKENIDMTEYMRTFKVDDSLVLAENPHIAVQVIKNAEEDYVSHLPAEKTDLDEIGLSVRAVSGIKRLGVFTVNEFRNTAPDFYDIRKNPQARNIGSRALREITLKLDELK